MAIADQGFRPFRSIPCEGIQMAFVNEVVSDEDIVRYKLPFKPGAGRCWTRDKENDCYLWGGISAGYARGYQPRGEFHFYLRGVLLDVSVEISQNDQEFFEDPDAVNWRRVQLIRPLDLGGLAYVEVVEKLRQALLAFGTEGRVGTSTSADKVRIEF
jgi:hypothetical protein